MKNTRSQTTITRYKMKKFSSSVTILTIVVGLASLVASVSLDRPEVDKQVHQNAAEGPLEAGDRFGPAHAPAIVNGPPLAQPFRPQLNPGIPGPNPGASTLIECYACSDCPKILPNTTSKICPYTLDSTKTKCLVYAEQYKHMKRPWYVRGCASERGSCADIEKAHSKHPDIVKLLNCYECEGDKCNTNSASHSLVDFTMAFFALVVTPLVAKYTLS